MIVVPRQLEHNGEPSHARERRWPVGFEINVNSRRPVMRVVPRFRSLQRLLSMFIRFVTDQLDVDTGQELGIFGAAYQLLDDDQTPEYSRKEIRATLNWFKTNLSIPDRFTRSRRPHRKDNGLCWFKTQATECMRHVRYLVHLVTEQDIVVRELLTDAPGYMIYEYDSQVVAQPFSSTPH